MKKVFLMFLCLVVFNFGTMTSFFAGIHRRVFTKEEDIRLIQLVKEYGENDWKLIASKMPDRNVRQCRERWKHFLSVLESKNIPFTLEEDELIRKKVIEFGHAWTRIAEFFPGRSDYQIKNRWFKILWDGFNNDNPTQTNKVISESMDSTTSQPENSSEGFSFTFESIVRPSKLYFCALSISFCAKSYLFNIYQTTALLK